MAIMEGGVSGEKTGLTYMTGCLFDVSSHHSSISTYIFDYDKHCEKYKESWAIERFGVLWVNYLWIEEPPPPSASKLITCVREYAIWSKEYQLWLETCENMDKAARSGRLPLLQHKFIIYIFLKAFLPIPAISPK